jgi:enamine deaminase RidA (YjgF/YER057c/UK114 family)
MTNTTAANGKEAAYFGVPWEDAYGYAQAIKVGDTIYVSGQLSHDDKGIMIAPAALDESGKPADFSTMEEQMRVTYANAAKLLARFGATLDHVVEETLYVLDVDAAFAVAGKVRKEAYAVARPRCARGSPRGSPAARARSSSKSPERLRRCATCRRRRRR